MELCRSVESQPCTWVRSPCRESWELQGRVPAVLSGAGGVRLRHVERNWLKSSPWVYPSACTHSEFRPSKDRSMTQAPCQRRAQSCALRRLQTQRDVPLPWVLRLLREGGGLAGGAAHRMPSGFFRGSLDPRSQGMPCCLSWNVSTRSVSPLLPLFLAASSPGRTPSRWMWRNLLMQGPCWPRVCRGCHLTSIV